VVVAHRGAVELDARRSTEERVGHHTEVVPVDDGAWTDGDVDRPLQVDAGVGVVPQRGVADEEARLVHHAHGAVEAARDAAAVVMQVAARDGDRRRIGGLYSRMVLVDLSTFDSHDGVLDGGQPDGCVLGDGAVANGQLSVAARHNADLTAAGDVDVVEEDGGTSRGQHTHLEAHDVHAAHLGSPVEDQRRLGVEPDRPNEPHKVPVTGDGDAGWHVRVRRGWETSVVRPHLAAYRVVGTCSQVDRVTSSGD